MAPPKTLRQKLSAFFTSISVEPVMLLDGLAFSNMVVLVENLQMDKVCHVNLNYSKEICGNLSSHKDVKEEMATEFSEFAMYNGIITAVIPLFFILFMGAWSDKYGRKVPLVASTIGHLLYSLGYLVSSTVDSWPVEYLLIVALLDSLGGGAVSFLTAANSYISDVTSEETRTSRLGLANSIWFLGGPMGTLLGTFIYKAGGYVALFGTSLGMYVVALVYIIVFVPESHGPFANVTKLEKILPPKQSLRLRESVAWVYGIDKKELKKELTNTKSMVQRKKSITVGQMLKDFFNPQRFVDSFRCTLKKREGHVRVYILLLILCNILRKLGRGAYMYLFARQVLHWEASDYGYWVTYKNFLATSGSLVAVPLLSGTLKMTDNMLAMVGAFSSVFDYVLYGMVREETYFFMWLAPVSALLVNSCAIAIRAMLSKYVPSDELGKVSAMLGALDGVVPMLSFTLYTAVYRATVSFYPGAQFFFGASANFLMVIIFILVMVMDKTGDYNVQSAAPEAPKGPVKEKSLVIRKDSRWLYDEENKGKVRLATILLSALNFSIEVNNIESSFGKPLETIDEEPEREAAAEVEDKEEARPKEQQQLNGRTQEKQVASESYDNPGFVEENHIA
ncbi:LOW QUALITY PROTEIN: probable peptidoglycan muropeptide transporter SLC46 [Macrobrachium nipponense]|uniref:LOW QUALITY PROTEIN: probable peptidoglycan muropeptide transporter SLC46 n=1 Tax=Macrobrachium nipponense TaxID=159736 RepID=UPI0030C83BA3